jgi:hypothetical protein
MQNGFFRLKLVMVLLRELALSPESIDFPQARLFESIVQVLNRILACRKTSCRGNALAIRKCIRRTLTSTIAATLKSRDGWCQPWLWPNYGG